jgi:hypothetical protein
VKPVPRKQRGRGECRVPNAPAASCALSSSSMHTSIHSGGTGIIRHSPRDGFNKLPRALPGDEFLLPPSPCEFTADRKPGWADRASTRLSTSNGCQDHTPSPSATLPLVLRARITHGLLARPATGLRARPCRVHRSPRSTSVTIAIRPSDERGMREGKHRSRRRQSELFFASGLDDPNQLDRACEIRFLARTLGGALSSYQRRGGAKIRAIRPTGD